MGSTKRLRVVFHSKEDLSAGYNLKKAETFLEHFKVNDELSINDLIELYNVKLYFDHNLVLLSWDDSKKEQFKKIVQRGLAIIKKFWLSITNENILDCIDQLDLQYRKFFWDLTNSFRTFERIDSAIFSSILKAHPQHINYILAHNNILTYFNKETRNFLMDYDKSAELLLSRFEEEHKHRVPNYQFPNALTLSDKEEIITRYIESGAPNLNFIRLIEHSRNTKDLKLSPKTRLKAKRKSEELNNKILEGAYTWSHGIEVAINVDQTEPVTYLDEDNTLKISYSKAFLDKQDNNAKLFHLFYSLFGYLDPEGLITLISNRTQRDVFEDVLMRSKNEYPCGIVFQRKSHVSDAQIHVFEYYLNQRATSLEEIIESFIKNFLSENFDLKSLRFQLPNKNSSFLEKIRVLAPEFEFLLKQYQSFVSEGQIDFDLLTLSSAPLNLREISSVNEKKYVYENSDKVKLLRYQFFSDQSPLYYVEAFGDKYDNLYDLLTSENIILAHFEDYQREILKHLIDDGYLITGSKDEVKIADQIFMYIIRELNRNEVISYWHYPKQVRDVIDQMINDNLLMFENTLFTMHEVNYFNYYLNMREFTNGFDLRNKYMHGTNTSLEKEHERDYYMLLKLIILVLLKIEDDLIAKNFSDKFRI